MTDAYARSTDPFTSREAAEGVSLNGTEQTVYDIIANGPDSGMTKDEIYAAQTDTHHERDTISPRLRPLYEKGKIVPIGSRKMKSRYHQFVWLDKARAVRLGIEPIPLMRHSRADVAAEKKEKRRRELVEEATSLIDTRLALATYLQDMIAADNGNCDPQMLARLIVRDWDIKPR